MERKTRWSFLLSDFNTNKLVLRPLGCVLWLEAAFLQGLPRAESTVPTSASRLPPHHTTARAHIKLLESTPSKPSQTEPTPQVLGEQSTQEMWERVKHPGMRGPLPKYSMAPFKPLGGGLVHYMAIDE